MQHAKKPSTIYLEFLRFYSGHARQTITDIEACTELPVPVERFGLQRARFSTHLLMKLQGAIRGGFTPNKILEDFLELKLANDPTNSTIGPLQNILRHDLGLNLTQGHLIIFPLVYLDQFPLNRRCFDIEGLKLVHTIILRCLRILSVPEYSGIITYVRRDCTHCPLDRFSLSLCFVICLIFSSDLGLLSLHATYTLFGLLSVLSSART